MTTIPPTPGGLALYSSPVPAALSDAQRIPAFVPWKGATKVRGLCPLRVNYSPPSWGGPAEAANEVD